MKDLDQAVAAQAFEDRAKKNRTIYKHRQQ